MPDPHPRPLIGGYYQYPSPAGGGPTWVVRTCHDLGFDAEVGHVDLWPAVVDRLAGAWGRDAGGLRRRLVGLDAGLSRGRVTRQGRTVLVLHGDDAPVADRRGTSVERYGLGGRLHRFLFDEPGRMLPGDLRRVEEAPGFRYA